MCPRLLYQGARIIAGYFDSLGKLICFKSLFPEKTGIFFVNSNEYAADIFTYLTFVKVKISFISWSITENFNLSGWSMMIVAISSSSFIKIMRI